MARIYFGLFAYVSGYGSPRGGPPTSHFSARGRINVSEDVRSAGERFVSVGRNQVPSGRP